jgi:hypothetical protein
MLSCLILRLSSFSCPFPEEAAQADSLSASPPLSPATPFRRNGDEARCRLDCADGAWRRASLLACRRLRPAQSPAILLILSASASRRFGPPSSLRLRESYMQEAVKKYTPPEPSAWVMRLFEAQGVKLAPDRVRWWNWELHRFLKRAAAAVPGQAPGRTGRCPAFARRARRSVGAPVRNG